MIRFVTNPMIRKELRQRLRERRVWLLPTLYLLVLAGTVSCAYYGITDSEMGANQGEVQGADIGEAIFLTVVITQMVVLLLMAPVFSAGSLTIEKEQRTFSGLLTSLLTARRFGGANLLPPFYIFFCSYAAPCPCFRSRLLSAA
jgi:ABC-2 type transport system permease protein